MSKVNYNGDNNYAESRIRGTVLKTVYNTVVLVDSLDYDEGRFNCRNLISGEYSYLDLDELDMDPVELGFINGRFSTNYHTRMPARHYKQGLTSYTFQEGFVDDAVWSSVTMAKCILGIYPKLIDCVESVFCGEASSRGFSRNFSVSSIGGDRLLTFRGNIVGEALFNTDNGLLQTRLSKKHNFLQEMLEHETAT